VPAGPFQASFLWIAQASFQMNAFRHCARIRSPLCADDGSTRRRTNLGFFGGEISDSTNLLYAGREGHSFSGIICQSVKVGTLREESMPEQSNNRIVNPADPSRPGKYAAGVVRLRFARYCPCSVPVESRFRQRVLRHTTDHLVCRFCGNPIELIGAWKCTCCYTRPGNYFGRCPKCLMHPRYIDCPVCRFTMDVR
jgi:hypothetical protein